MVSVIIIALAALPLYWLYSTYNSLQKNIQAAKLSGLPYVVTPIHIYSRIWLITHRLFLPLLYKLPTAWTNEWINLIHPDWPWHKLFEPFARHGDTFITVAPSGILVWTSSPEAIHQITQRRDAFPKPLDSYKVLDIYGRNVVSTEGGEWRMHRKVTSPGFNEKNNALVFKESIAQAQGMLRKWMGPDGKGNHTVTDIPMDSMRVTLHIISKVGFGVGLLWPGEEPTEEQKGSSLNYSSHEPSEGFTMSFEHALSTLLDSLVWVLLFPDWLLKRLPFKNAKESRESYINWGKYMKAIYDQKVIEAKTGDRREGMDLMGSLVRSSMIDQNGQIMDAPALSSKDDAGRFTLSQPEILGNAFVLLLAGHETTANSVHFALMMLAMAPESQRRLQADVESIFSNTPPEKWNYDTCINKCLGSMVGAVLNEELRLMPPVIAIPKSVKKGQDQTIVIDGKKRILPGGAFININTVGVHRNPRYWPSRGPSKISGRPDDLDDFIPERWLVKDGARSGTDTPDQSESGGEDDFGGFTGESSAAELFRPARGAFVPFSDGPRSCLGRRLAQVEVMAVLAVIFQHYSIELAVDQWATDDEVEKMSKQERIEVYEKAQRRAQEIIRTASTRITLKLHDGVTFVPARLVHKGEERFLNLFD